MNAFILLGGPGAGKGTAAEELDRDPSVIHISTGDMLRAELKSGTEFGREAEAYMSAGELVPDELILRMLESRMDFDDDGHTVMFDGVPRTLCQARMLDEILARHGAGVQRVFYLKAPEEVLSRRLGGRRTCRDCGAIYHVVNLPPRAEGVCDACGGELYRRPDDSEETIRNRLDVFRQQTRPLEEFYRKAGVLVEVDASRNPEETMKAIRASLAS